MLTVNIDTQDWLFIKQTGNVRDIEFAQAVFKK